MNNMLNVRSSYREFYAKPETTTELNSYFSDIKFKDHSVSHIDDDSYRSCELASPAEYEYYSKVTRIITRYFNYINNNFFLYELNNRFEIQLVRYTAGSNFKWHCDYGGQVPVSSGEPNTVRKLSLSLQLSDPKEYEGGEVELILMDGRHYTMEKELGAAIVFDSRTPHKAHPVTSGTRLVLVCWAHGPELT
jgi:predicted 2-oxoglutarate/Fe(II)-dependent dioxygenase YbiX